MNVFPVILPPLRARCEDIPELVIQFVDRFNHRMGKHIARIPPETMAAFQSYSWPGNIRELQNLIERAVIMANDEVLPNPLPALGLAPVSDSSGVSHPHRVFEAAVPRTLRDSERALILEALDATSWVIGGSDGAAAQLGLKRTTLIYRMKKLGIERPERRTDSPHGLVPPERRERPVAL